LSNVKFKLSIFFALLTLAAIVPDSFSARVALASNIKYAGVNLSGAEFGSSLPGTFGVDYTYPTHSEVDYFVGKGMNIIRLPFRWERLQPSEFVSLDSTELGRMDDFVSYATGKGATVLLDPHNYARYYSDSNIIGTASVPATAFQDFWSKLAAHYKNNNRVIFGLMNEPNTMTTELWRDDANAAIAAIRGTGASNLILVPGNAWTGASTWYDNWYGTPNATDMLTIVDPGNNYAFEVHQYLDSDSSGTSATCVSTTIGSQRLQAFTGWLRQNGKRGFLGEFAGAQNSTCYAALDDMLTFIDNNLDVWMGWTYWSAGPWWGNYMFSIEPNNGQDQPQMAILAKHFPSVGAPQPYHVFLPFVKR
jgi:endoglucanase